MILAGDFRNGLTFEMDGQVMQVSITAPEITFLYLVRTNAAPLPGFTCWNSMTCRTLPCPSSKVIPFLKSPATTIFTSKKRKSNLRQPLGCYIVVFIIHHFLAFCNSFFAFFSIFLLKDIFLYQNCTRIDLDKRSFGRYNRMKVVRRPPKSKILQKHRCFSSCMRAPHGL